MENILVRLFFTLAVHLGIGLLVGIGYRRLLTFRGNPSTANFRSRAIAGSWGKWAAIIILIMPLNHFRAGSDGIAAIILGNAAIKLAVWLWVGVGGSILIGLVAFAVYRSKERLHVQG